MSTRDEPKQTSRPAERPHCMTSFATASRFHLVPRLTHFRSPFSFIFCHRNNRQSNASNSINERDIRLPNKVQRALSDKVWGTRSQYPLHETRTETSFQKPFPGSWGCNLFIRADAICQRERFVS
ncbi:hypothetical protein TNCT_220851 [Trichonephila clavata]|uniref:Uncharacterized protein n=1 Tax=Trichonephila clavata TaxID=2740835 RepID=A0A8X6GP89_TRICU|nr:hypothetical protein TNCT_220851 [Trichonephila clavata]